MIIALISFLLLSHSAFAVYNPGDYGEKDFDLYYGAMSLSYETDDYQNQVIFKETEVFNNYMDYFIQPDLVDFDKFFSKSLASSASCPTSEISKMYDYLRFVNRVLAASYLFEEIVNIHKTTKKLGNENACNVNWEEVLKSCKPRSDDMKFFVRSAKHIVKDLKETIIPVTHSVKLYQQDWMRQFKNKDYKDIAHYRLNLICKNDPNCNSYMNYEKATDLLSESCKVDTQVFTKICSELDNLYGLSSVEESYPLVVNSDILEVANENGFAAGCLRRFKAQTKRKEVNNPILETIFPITYQTLFKEKARYLQGRLFPAGSLKQFTDKGLVELFKEEKKEVVAKVEIKETPKIKPKPVEDKIEFIDRFQKKKKIKSKKQVILKKKPKKVEIKKSSFLTAVELLNQMDINSVKVDMLKFKYDFLFSISLRKLLDDNMKMYISRTAIEQMKKFDKLGSPEGPMPLIFLKYLIETDKHQSLYNILNVIGDKFYVKNDIDSHIKNLDPFNFISLKNDESTNFKWQIFIEKEIEASKPVEITQ